MAKNAKTDRSDEQMAKAIPSVERALAEPVQSEKKRAAFDPSHSNSSGNEPSDVGDIEEETLDRDAPYNKTYGLKDHFQK